MPPVESVAGLGASIRVVGDGRGRVRRLCDVVVEMSSNFSRGRVELPQLPTTGILDDR